MVSVRKKYTVHTILNKFLKQNKNLSRNIVNMAIVKCTSHNYKIHQHCILSKGNTQKQLNRVEEIMLEEL